MSPLLEDYCRHAADYGMHVTHGDAAATNESYERVQSAFRTLVENGQGDELFDLYNDVDPSVQCWAAAHTLELSETRTMDKLVQLESAAIPHISTDAKHTIEEWKSGALRFLP